MSQTELAGTPAGTPDDGTDPALEQLYTDFAANDLTPLWTQLDDLMPLHPTPPRGAARLAVGHAVPAGRARRRPGAGRPRRRAPGDRARQPRSRRAPPTRRRRSGRPSSTSGRTRPHPSTGTARTRSASSSRARACGRSSTATRSRMRRGDFLLTPGWNFHGHHNDTDQPMAWIDGLDIPFVHYTDIGVLRVRHRAGDRRRRRPTSPAPSGCGRTRACGRCPGCRHQASSPIARLPLGAHRPGAERAARAGGRGPAGDGRAGPRGDPLRQPDHRRRRHADDPRRVPPACGAGAADPPGTRSARRCSRCSTGRGDVVLDEREHRARAGRPLRRPVVGAVVAAADDRVRPLPLLRRARSSSGSAFTARYLPEARRHETGDLRRPNAGRSTSGGPTRRRRAVDPGAPDVGTLLRDPDWPERASRGGGAAAVATARRLAGHPVVPSARQDRLRRTELPQPHPGDGSRAAGVPDPVRQVHRGADRRGRRHRDRPVRPRRSTGRASWWW